MKVKTNSNIYFVKATVVYSKNVAHKSWFTPDGTFFSTGLTKWSYYENFDVINDVAHHARSVSRNIFSDEYWHWDVSIDNQIVTASVKQDNIFYLRFSVIIIDKYNENICYSKNLSEELKV